VLSGPGAGNPHELLTIVRDVINSGAAGVIMGRNIWQFERPTAMIEAVMRIVHEDLSVEKAKKIID